MSADRGLLGREDLAPDASYVRPGQSAPVEFLDAVELWARKSNRHLYRLAWKGFPFDCWVIELTLHPDHPRNKAWQEGKMRSRPVEPVLLHRWDMAQQKYVAFDLLDLGVSGLIEMLEKADVQSGRGEHPSLYHAMVENSKHNDQQREENMNRALEFAGQNARDNYRRIFKVPFAGWTRKLAEGGRVSDKVSEP